MKDLSEVMSCRALDNSWLLYPAASPSSWTVLGKSASLLSERRAKYCVILSVCYIVYVARESNPIHL